MMSVKVTFEDGNTLTTRFNGSIKDAAAYYVGQSFQFGDTEEHPADKMVQAVAVAEVSEAER